MSLGSKRQCLQQCGMLPRASSFLLWWMGGWEGAFQMKLSWWGGYYV
jgi:hypothetical protein